MIFYKDSGSRARDLHKTNMFNMVIGNSLKGSEGQLMVDLNEGSGNLEDIIVFSRKLKRRNNDISDVFLIKLKTQNALQIDHRSNLHWQRT